MAQAPREYRYDALESTYFDVPIFLHMPPRLMKIPIAAEWERLHVGERDVLASWPKLVALIRSNGGGDAGTLFAEPVFEGEDGGLAGWRSPHGGRLVPATDGNAHAELAARVAGIADRLERQGDAGRLVAHSLRSALVTPDGAPAYFVDAESGRPVLVNWGMALPGQARPMAPETGGHQPAAASAAAAATAAPPSEIEPRGPWRHNLAATLAWFVPAALMALVAWLGMRALEPLPIEILQIIPEAPPAPDPTERLDGKLAALDSAIAEAADAAARFAEVCVLPAVAPRPTEAAVPPPSLPAPPVETPGEEQDETLAVVAPRDTGPAEAPAPERKPEPPARAAAPPREAEPAAPVQPAAPAPGNRAACRPTWPPGRSPRMLFVVDGSGSMKDGITGASSRMAAAQGSINRVVRSLHQDIRIGMVSFSDCGATAHSRYYSAAERGQLLGRVNAISPGRRTSLASSIRRAGAMATRRAETVMVIVSDGEDTCGSDPCAAARGVRGQKPNVTINVIDLSGGASRGVLQCIAGAGGGRVFTPRSAGQMANQMQQATGQPNASGC